MNSLTHLYLDIHFYHGHYGRTDFYHLTAALPRLLQELVLNFSPFRMQVAEQPASRVQNVWPEPLMYLDQALTAELEQDSTFQLNRLDLILSPSSDEEFGRTKEFMNCIVERSKTCLFTFEVHTASASLRDIWNF